jgi:SAM-dependent methyltransferase
VSYRWLAEYYDSVFDFAPGWGAKARDRVLGPVLPKVRSACDIACGTGSTALWLARKGIRTSAMDLSPGMVRQAREKARAAGLSIRVECGDMRELRLPEPVDLVTCEFDALNHVPRRSDLKRVATAVARALVPGGWFYFDVNTRLAFRKLWPTTWWIEKRDVILAMHGGYNAKRDQGWSDVEVFVRKGRLWERHTERIVEVCWTNREIRSALKEAGFSTIRGWDAAPLMVEGGDVPPGCRTFYLARKKGRPLAPPQSA